jgi:penicillin-binding protein 2
MKTRIEEAQDYSGRLPEKSLSSRQTTFLLIILAIFTLLTAQLFNLQIVKGERYRVLSEENHMRIVPTVAPRGDIRAQGGETLVTSRPAFSVFYWYLDSKQAEETLPLLAEILDLELEEIESKIRQYAGRYYEPIPLARDIPPETYIAIAEDAPNLPGVFIEAEPIRGYPFGELASPVLGYVGEISASQLKDPRFEDYRIGQSVGQQGLESYYEEVLKGQDGGIQVEVDYRGRPTGNVGPGIDPIPGSDLELYLDVALQEAAEKALYEAMESSPTAKGGSAVVLDVKSGGILAMASVPSFDPNKLVSGISQAELSSLLEEGKWRFPNYATTGLYPPGSTFKVISAIAALDQEAATQDERIYDQGYHPLAPTLVCHQSGGHGSVNLVEALGLSCNVYFYEMGRRLGVDTIASYATALGLGQKTGVDLPSENYGTVPTTEWKQKAYTQDRVAQPEFLLAEHMMAAMGQVFHLDTPIQMASVVQAIANDGVRLRPRVVKQIVSHDGEIIMQSQPEVTGHLEVDQWILDTVKEGMRYVTCEPRGTAYWAMYGLPDEVAGKTGTAENPLGASHAWFVGFAPVENPEIAVSVVVEQGGSGSGVAAPVAKSIFEVYLTRKLEEVTLGDMN